MLGNWLHILDDKVKKITMEGVAVLCWAIWKCRNDIIFNKIKYSSFLQATFREYIGYSSGHSYNMITQ
jgi:hypothetical protein